MAKLTDKFFNRVIEGDLELSSADKSNNGITKVVANPTLAGTEAGLEGLEVSGTKYSVKKGAVAGVEGAPSGTIDKVLGLSAQGKLVKSDSFVENMSGYSASKANTSGWTNDIVYIGAVKNGNKLTIVVASKITKTDASAVGYPYIAYVTIPADIHNKLYPFSGTMLDYQNGLAYAGTQQNCKQYVEKASNNRLAFGISSTGGFVVDTEYYIRFEVTFLLSDSLIQGE